MSSVWVILHTLTKIGRGHPASLRSSRGGAVQPAATPDRSADLVLRGGVVHAL
ncbi:hypothetical protein N136_04799, partial [Leifsonia aquatica ATCC 14665]